MCTIWTACSIKHWRVIEIFEKLFIESNGYCHIQHCKKILQTRAVLAVLYFLSSEPQKLRVDLIELKIWREKARSCIFDLMIVTMPQKVYLYIRHAWPFT